MNSIVQNLNYLAFATTGVWMPVDAGHAGYQTIIILKGRPQSSYCVKDKLSHSCPRPF